MAMAMVIKQYVWSISLRRASIPSIPPIPCSVPTCPCPHCPVLPTLSKYLLCLTFRLQTTSQQKPSFIPNTSHTLPAPSLATTGCQHIAAHRAIEVALNWHLICRQVITEYPVTAVWSPWWQSAMRIMTASDVRRGGRGCGGHKTFWRGLRIFASPVQRPAPARIPTLTSPWTPHQLALVSTG